MMTVCPSERRGRGLAIGQLIPKINSQEDVHAVHRATKMYTELQGIKNVHRITGHWEMAASPVMHLNDAKEWQEKGGSFFSEWHRHFWIPGETLTFT